MAISHGDYGELVYFARREYQETAWLLYPIVRPPDKLIGHCVRQDTGLGGLLV